MDKTRPIFFVHVPKTAGTSFRIGLEKAVDAVFYDYGRKSRVTSDLIRDTFYSGNDLYGLARALDTKGRSVIAGHVPITRYSLLSGADNIVSFVRDPVEHFLSHYIHSTTINNFTGDFEAFLARPKMRDMQQRMLTGALPLAAIGVIGLTERYDDTLALINAHFGLAIPALTLNTARKPDEYGAEKQALKERYGEEIRAAVAGDLAFHAEVSALFETRWQAFKAGRPFVHGVLERADRRRVSGFAYRSDSDAAVTVEIAVNGGVVADDILANRPDIPLAAYAAPRRGFVRFDFAFEERPAKGATVEVRAGPDRQLIGTRSID